MAFDGTLNWIETGSSKATSAAPVPAPAPAPAATATAAYLRAPLHWYLHTYIWIPLHNQGWRERKAQHVLRTYLSIHIQPPPATDSPLILEIDGPAAFSRGCGRVLGPYEVPGRATSTTITNRQPTPPGSSPTDLIYPLRPGQNSAWVGLSSPSVFYAHHVTSRQFSQGGRRLPCLVSPAA